MTTDNPTQAIQPGKSNHWKTPYTIYKPNNRGSGGAISFAFNPSKDAVFVEAANQSGERQFDWENKIIMKWGLNDLGTMLAAIQGKEPGAKLFHQTDRANSASSLVPREKPDQAPLFLTISRQDSENKEVRKVSISISQAEAAILETALRTAIGRILGW